MSGYFALFPSESMNSTWIDRRMTEEQDVWSAVPGMLQVVSGMYSGGNRRALKQNVMFHYGNAALWRALLNNNFQMSR